MDETEREELKEAYKKEKDLGWLQGYSRCTWSTCAKLA